MENEQKPVPIKPMTCKKQSDDVDWFLGQKIVTRYCRVEEKKSKTFLFREDQELGDVKIKVMKSKYFFWK